MSVNDPCFVSWEERIVCHERGNRVVHYFVKDASGMLILAVVGTERSVRHMLYVVPDEFVETYGSSIFVSSSRKWRARREVVDWLTLLVFKHRPSSCVANLEFNDSEQDAETLDISMSRLNTELTYLRDQMVPRKLKVQNSDIKWSGVAWICSKQLKHYPSFYRHGTTITVHSFVFIMAKEESHYLGYLEDLYEDKKGLKKVKVRWFHHNQEVKGFMPELNPHPKEVFMTTHVQVISAECVDGPATVLIPKHYEKYVGVTSESSSVHICFRQFKNNRVKPFALTKLRGYSNQAILSCIDDSLDFDQKAKSHKPFKERKRKFAFVEPVNVGAKENGGPETGYYGVGNFAPENHVPKSERPHLKLRLKLSRKKMSSQAVASQDHHPVPFKVDEKIELLCQDSGMRGCWFRCKILQASPMKLKVQYVDVEDVEGPGNLEEWVPAFRVAAPDKLGLRSRGRTTIRPYPPEESAGSNFDVGTSVDAWLGDGWWEGVVTEVDISENDTLQVYIPGEGKSITVQKNNVRTSKDWIDDKWIAIKEKSDILSHLASKTRHTMSEASAHDVSALHAHKPLTTPELKTIEDNEHESLGFSFAVGSETHPCTSKISGEDGDDNTNSNDKAVYGANLVSGEDSEKMELEM